MNIIFTFPTTIKWKNTLVFQTGRFQICQLEKKFSKEELTLKRSTDLENSSFVDLVLFTKLVDGRSKCKSQCTHIQNPQRILCSYAILRNNHRCVTVTMILELSILNHRAIYKKVTSSVWPLELPVFVHLNNVWN